MDALPPFPYADLGPLALELRQRLGHCLMLRPLQHGNLKRIIIKFGRAFSYATVKG